jgi:hypothetical protein
VSFLLATLNAEHHTHQRVPALADEDNAAAASFLACESALVAGKNMSRASNAKQMIRHPEAKLERKKRTHGV